MGAQDKTMKMPWHFVLFLALTVRAGAQNNAPQNLSQILGFENGLAGTLPAA